MKAGGCDCAVVPSGGHSEWSTDDEVGAIDYPSVNARCGARTGDGNDLALLLLRILSGNEAIHQWRTSSERAANS